MIKRRQFLILTSLSSFGFFACHSKVQSQDPLLGSTSANDLTTSLPEGKPLLRFVSLADTGTGAAGQYAVAQAMNQYYQQNAFPLAILAGDNIYNDGEMEKIKQVFELPYQELLQNRVKFYACLGNHDIRTENGDPQVRYPGFNMTGRYYTFTYNPVQFFALDTNSNADWDQQITWLEKELSQSTAPWKIVFGHHQLYASGHYGFNQLLVPKLTPLFHQYGVKLYLNGHEHHYERTTPIQGVTYLTCGGGAGTREVGKSEWTAYAASRLSFAAFDVYPGQIVVKGIGTDGKIFDQGIIS
jgi:acid phosphatase